MRGALARQIREGVRAAWRDQLPPSVAGLQPPHRCCPHLLARHLCLQLQRCHKQWMEEAMRHRPVNNEPPRGVHPPGGTRGAGAAPACT